MIGLARSVVITAATTLALIGCGSESTGPGEADDRAAAAEARVAELEAEKEERAAQDAAQVAELQAQVEELTDEADAATSVAATTTVPPGPPVTETPAPPPTPAPAPPATPTPAPPPTPAPAPPATPAPPPPPTPAPAPPPQPPSDPFLIPFGVIEDGIHVGYLVSQSAGSISFDRADIQPDGTWTNVNPKVRTLPVNPSVNWAFGSPPGTLIELSVTDQLVDWVSTVGG